MKVLWLTSSPAGASDITKYKLPGRGWIGSLENHLKQVPEIDLAVCFFDNKIRDFKFKHANVTYYPIVDKLHTLVGKLNSKLFNKLYDTNVPSVMRVIDDFKPDVIQIFGTESGLGEIVTKTDVPVIIHIQGLINPIYAAWFPKGISQRSILMNSTLSEIVRKNTAWGLYLLLKKAAEREEFILKNASNFFGRTEWDKRILKMYNKNASYVHCDEILRPFFFTHQWRPTRSSTLRLVTTINANIYKGLDTVLETTELLKRNKNLPITWSIIGINSNDKIVRLFERVCGKRFSQNIVKFRGVKTGNELVSELQKSDLFIHPSHIDNSPNSVCEAMLLGMPVIAGNVGGLSSIITNNENGILYNSYDPFELAAIISEYAENTDVLNRLGANARKTALARHDEKAIISTIIDTYESLAKKQVVEYVS